MFDNELNFEYLESLIFNEGGGYSYSSTRVSKLKKKKNRELQNHIRTYIKSGWDKEYARFIFQNLTLDNLESYGPDEFILEYSKYQFEENDHNSDIVKSYTDIGLREDVANRLKTIVEPLLDCQYTYTQVLTIGIEFLLGKYKPVGAVNVPFLSNKDKILTRIDDNREIGPFYNIPKGCNILQERVINSIMKTDYSDKNSIYLFHATSWGSLKNIKKHGIILSKGRPCLDFGIQPGFYLTPDIRTCLEWGARSAPVSSNEIAILVYKIPLQYIINQESSKVFAKTHVNEFTGILFNDVSYEWRNLTASSRQCIDYVNDLDKVDYVYGPMVKNPQPIKDKREQPQAHYPLKWQFTVKSQRLAETINKLNVTTFIFEKQQI
jgi:hypothetical protein